jgi:hypothetical protein
MATAVWDKKVALMLELIQQRTTMSEVYCEALKTLLTVGHSEEKALSVDIKCSTP